MSRRFTAAALALVVAGGVYMTAGRADASNMGFKLERSFDAVVLPGPPQRIFRNIYYLSMPLFNGLADIADAAGAGTDGPCTGTGDGVVDSVDFLCDAWTSRQGSMLIERFDTDTCNFLSTGITYDSLFMSVFLNGAPFPLLNAGSQIDDDGYKVTVPYEPMTGAVQNPAVIVGSHDPSYTGFTLAIPASMCRPNRAFLNLPYHAMYRNAFEGLCGLEGPTGWQDGNGDTLPDTCPDGIYPDRASGGSGAQIIIQTFDNIPDASLTDNAFVSLGVAYDEIVGDIVFNGTPFDFVPGDAYEVQLDHDNMPPEHTPTVWQPPHF
jgi:hypothetical protein